jgi:hypothetical protein
MTTIDGPYKPGDFERLVDSQTEAEILALKGNLGHFLSQNDPVEWEHIDPRERHPAVRVLE